MMVANSKSFHKIFIPVLLLAGCGQAEITPKWQAVIVVDKTNSIVYTKPAQLEQRIALKIEQTYVSAKNDIQLSLLKINGNAQVIPAFHRFEEKYPDEEEGGGRTFEEELLRWKAKKKIWISNEGKQIDSLIEASCKSNTTDIFSTFKGIQEAQKNHGPWDSVNVYILSDMTNTSGRFNMLKLKSSDTAFSKGKMVCQDLITQGQISAGNTENLNLVIYTPGNMQKTDLVTRFWEGFFQQWGLKVSQYQFENE